MQVESTFPFLSPELDQKESIPATDGRLSCWLHCFRDVLYAEHVSQVAPLLVQPLYFCLERDTAGFLHTIYGGLDYSYYQPTFNRGVSATRHPILDTQTAWKEILSFLEDGHWPMIDAQWSKVRFSRFYRTKKAVLHTVILAGYNGEQVLLADIRSRLTTSERKPRFWVDAQQLLAGLEAPATWLSYKFEEPRKPWQEEWRSIVEQTLTRMEHPPHEEGGLQGIHSYASYLRSLPTTFNYPEHYPLLVWSGWRQITHHIIADRLMFSKVVQSDLNLKHLSDHNVVSLLEDITREWEEVAALLLLMGESRTLDGKENVANTVDNLAIKEEQLCNALRDYIAYAF
jgi:hypothetical protein